MTGLVGSSGQLDIFETDMDCNGIVYGPYNRDSIATWSTSDSSIATVSGGSCVLLAPGNCGITANFLATVYNSNQGCQPIPENVGASCSVTVQRPTTLEVVSDSNSQVFCPSIPLPGAYGNARYIKYQVLDQVGNPIQRAGMTVTEVLTLTSDTCNVGVPAAGTWTTNASGVMTGNDQIVLCSSICNVGNCTTSWNQRFTVNGFNVFVASQFFATSGSYNAVTVSCTSFPTVTIMP
jgi:hypothetical protein